MEVEGGMASLVVLLLAERAHSEGARSTRALEDRWRYGVRNHLRAAPYGSFRQMVPDPISPRYQA